MKSRSILQIGLLALAVILLCASAVQAAERGGRQMRKHTRQRRQMMLQQMHHPLVVSVWSLPCLQGELTMTPEQRERLNDLNQRFTDRVYDMVSQYYSQADTDVPALQDALNRLNRKAEHRAWRILTPVQRQALRKYLWTYYSGSTWDEGGVSPGPGTRYHLMGPWSDRPFGMRRHRMERGERSHRGKRHRQRRRAVPQ